MTDVKSLLSVHYGAVGRELKLLRLLAGADAALSVFQIFTIIFFIISVSFVLHAHAFFSSKIDFSWFLRDFFLSH